MIDVNQDVVTGHFSRIMREMGLLNVFETCHEKHNIPATHHRGRKPISAIYIDQRMQCNQCGILPKTFGVHGDHRNMYADISAQTFLGSSIYDVETQPMKTLQLKHSQIVNKFIHHMKKHLKSTNLLKKTLELNKKVTYPCSKEIEKEMEKIDQQLGRAIAAGKKKCRKIRMGAIPFSDVFIKLRNERRLWTSIKKKKIGQNISYSTIRRLSDSLNIPQPMSMPINMINELKREVEKKDRSFKQQTMQ